MIVVLITIVVFFPVEVSWVKQLVKHVNKERETKQDQQGKDFIKIKSKMEWQNNEVTIISQYFAFLQ